MVKDEDLEDISKEELLKCAQRYKRRLERFKESFGNLDRHKLMLALAASASSLATACVKGASDQSPTDITDGEVDRYMRDVLEVYNELIEVRGHTMWSRKNTAS